MLAPGGRELPCGGTRALTQLNNQALGALLHDQARAEGGRRLDHVLGPPALRDRRRLVESVVRIGRATAPPREPGDAASAAFVRDRADRGERKGREAGKEERGRGKAKATGAEAKGAQALAGERRALGRPPRRGRTPRESSTSSSTSGPAAAVAHWTVWTAPFAFHFFPQAAPVPGGPGPGRRPGGSDSV